MAKFRRMPSPDEPVIVLLPVFVGMLNEVVREDGMRIKLVLPFGARYMKMCDYISYWKGLSPKDRWK